MKKLILALTLIGTIKLAFGQGLPLPNNIQSPNASGLGKYGDVPVSYYTGAANIGIPIYSLNVRGIPLDISLNYDASGIGINSHPGWVGQNWSLSAGGVITRTVRGSMDELELTDVPFNYNEQGYFFHYDELSNAETFTRTSLGEKANDAVIELKDYQPDIFTFNFMGITGKFFLGNDGEWKISSEHNLKLIYNDNLITPIFETINDGTYPSPLVIGGFKLIDDNGTTYVFGYDPNSTPEEGEKQKKAIEYSIDFFSQWDNYWVANAWFLTKVIDKYGEVVYTFEYTHDRFVASFYRNQTYWINKVDDQYGSVASFQNPYIVNRNIFVQLGIAIEEAILWFYEKLGWDANLYLSEEEKISLSEKLSIGGNLILPSHLSLITSSNYDRIRFEKEITSTLDYDEEDFEHMYCLIDDHVEVEPLYYLQRENDYTGEFMTEHVDTVKAYFKRVIWFKLRNIKISNRSIDVKQIRFKYNEDYGVTNQRLNLLELEIHDNNISSDLKFNSYKFGYNNFGSLPQTYLSKEIDNWGFYNGHEYPNISISNLENHYNERQTNPDFVTIGMLNSIIYPTGGYSKFEYEPHFYSKIMNDHGTDSYPEDGIAGGVRIKKIIDFDGKVEKIRNFKYVLDYENNKNSTISSGILTRKPRYFWDDLRVCDGPLSECFDGYAFSSTSIVPLSNSSGTHIGYSEVVEQREDGSYILYSFSDYNIHPDEAPYLRLTLSESPYDKYCDRSLLRSKLLTTKYYNADNQKIKQLNIKYRDDTASYDTKYVFGTNATYIGSSSSDDVLYKGELYKLYYFDYDIKEEEVISYYDDDSATEKTVYVKEDILPSELDNKSEARLTSQTIKTVSEDEITTYYSYPMDKRSEAYMQDLIDDFRISEIIETKSINKGNKAIGVIKSDYKEDDGDIIPAQLLESKTDESTLETEVIYDKYINGKIVEYHKPDGIHTTIVWGHNYNYLIAKIENATYSEVEPYYQDLVTLSNDDMDHCFGSESCYEQNLRAAMGDLRENLPNAMVTSYTYDPGFGITSITDPAGKTEYYCYDEFNRLKTVYNSEEQIIKTYEYNLREIPYPFNDFTCTVNGKTNYELGETMDFNIQVDGGSGDYSYDIKLLKAGSVVSSSTSSTLNYLPTNYGEYTLYCIVTDNTTGSSITRTKTSYVNKVFCEFRDITPNYPYATDTRTGNIYTPLADVVEITYIRTGTQSVTVEIEIGDHRAANFTVGQEYTIQVSANNQGKIPCSIDFPFGVGDNEIEIKINRLINGTTDINPNQNVLSIPSPY